jgi:hypothetical protein
MPTEKCIICGLPTTTEYYPPVCADCRREPFSHPDSKQGVLGLLGLPLEVAPLLELTCERGVDIGGRQYDGLVVAAAGLIKRGVALTQTTDLPRLAAGDLSVPYALVGAAILPLRELVFFKGYGMWLEVRWRGQIGRSAATTHNQDPGRRKEEEALVKRAYRLLALSRSPGRPEKDTGYEERRRRRDMQARKALAMKARYRSLSWATIAGRLGHPPDTLKGWVADYRKREGARGVG